MDKEKILICGFPHCGTSILKSIIGHIPEIYEIINEVYDFDWFLNNQINEKNKKFILGKCPWYFDIMTKEDKFKDCHIIFILRNPLYVFSSLNERFNFNIPFTSPDNHSIELYIETCKSFLEERDNNNDKCYFIRYEDIFENNYKNLKTIFDNIGIEYNDNIFDNTKYNNKIVDFLEKNNIIVNAKNHTQYRTNQINKEFINNNINAKINLTEKQLEKILNDETINILYPDIKKIYNEYCKKK